MATGLSAGNPVRCRWITSVSRDFTGAAAAAPNTPQDCRAHGKLARPRRHSEWSVNRRLSLPRFEPWTCHQEPQLRHDMGAALRPEREWSATPLALPLPRMQPRWLQVSGLARDGLRHCAAGLRRMRGEVHRAATALLCVMRHHQTTRQRTAAAAGGMTSGRPSGLRAKARR